MNKKTIIASLLALITSFSASACKITITNDSNTFVKGRDFSESPKINSFTIASGQTEQIGENPDVRGKFSITIGGGSKGKTRNWHIKQIACSKSHKIHLNTSDIQANKTDKKLFEANEYP